MKLGATGLTAGVRFLAGLRQFALFENVETGSGAYPTFYSVGTGDYFPGVKATGALS
jgi:hypothetical protein